MKKIWEDLWVPTKPKILQSQRSKNKLRISLYNKLLHNKLSLKKQNNPKSNNKLKPNKNNLQRKNLKKLNLKQVILSMSIVKSFNSEKPHFIQARSNKSMCQLILQTTSSHKPNKDSPSFSESSPSATIKSLMTLMSTSSQSEVTRDMNTSNKSDSKLEPKKEPKLKLPLKFLLSNKIIKFQESFKFNSKTQDRCASQSASVAKFLKLLVSKNSSKSIKIHGWLRSQPKRIKSECHQFLSKTSQISTLLCKLRR